MRPGEVIGGKYQIEAELGEGGMGLVLAASHLTLGSAVAIKLLKTDAMKVPQVPQRFLREARAAGRLRNEHVARVMDVGVLPSGEPYMVMELLRGVDLSTLLEQGRIPAMDVLEYVAQACTGLAEAHAIGMVHRDVKPANLFVTRRPNGAPLVKVLDFGIATAAAGDPDHGLTSTLTVMGSPSYMSPEQLRAARDVDARSDIWSLGVTLYELLASAQPFEAPTLTALTLKIVSEPRTPLRGVPPALAAIVDRCLEKDRERRFANVAELAAALAPLFPGGHAHAEMVAGTLQQPQPLPPWPVTSGGAGRGARAASVAAPVGASVAAVAADPMATTTGMTAGESAPMLPRAGGRRRTAWVVLGAAVAGALVSAGLVLSQRSEGSAPPAPGDSAATRPAAAAAPAKEAASAEPEVTRPLTPAALEAAAKEAAAEAAAKETAAKEAAAAKDPAAAKETAAAAAAAKEAAAEAAKDPEATAKDPEATAKDPAKAPEATADRQPGKQPGKRPFVKRPPVKTAPADSPRPAKEPVKKPCAPNDPACGL